MGVEVYKYDSSGGVFVEFTEYSFTEYLMYFTRIVIHTSTNKCKFLYKYDSSHEVGPIVLRTPTLLRAHDTQLHCEIQHLTRWMQPLTVFIPFVACHLRVRKRVKAQMKCQ